MKMTYLIEDVMLDVFKDEFFKTYDKQHPCANHRGLVAMDGTDEEGYGRSKLAMKRTIGSHTGMSIATSALKRTAGTSICICAKGTSSSTLLFLNFHAARAVIRQARGARGFDSVVFPADVVIKKRSDHGEKGLSKGSGWCWKIYFFVSWSE